MHIIIHTSFKLSCFFTNSPRTPEWGSPESLRFSNPWSNHFIGVRLHGFSGKNPFRRPWTLFLRKKFIVHSKSLQRRAAVWTSFSWKIFIQMAVNWIEMVKKQPFWWAARVGAVTNRRCLCSSSLKALRMNYNFSKKSVQGRRNGFLPGNPCSLTPIKWLFYAFENLRETAGFLGSPVPESLDCW